MARYTNQVNKCLREIKNGKGSQMSELFDLTYNHFIAVAKYRLRDKSLCEDAVLETYENAYKYIQSFDPEKDGYNWMYKTLMRIVASYNQKEADRQNGECEMCDEICPTADEDDVARVDILNAVKDMDEVNKRIVFMYYYEDLSMREVGARLGMSVVAVHKRVKKIEKTIKDYFSDG